MTVNMFPSRCFITILFLFAIAIIFLFYNFVSIILDAQQNKGKPTFVSHLGNYETKETRRRGFIENCTSNIFVQDYRNDTKDLDINVACSDDISLDRDVPDTRLLECMHWDYSEDLSNTSVIIAFHNISLSVLLRNIHSVVNRSPKKLLKEVLLIDDFSDNEDLTRNISNHIKQFNGLVRLISNHKREGLIQARSRGAEEAKGDIIVFLDAHCEVNVNWLPPLLDPIQQDSTVLTVPIVDSIDQSTFEYRLAYTDNSHRSGTFNWYLEYIENKTPERYSSKHESEPYKSPVYAGVSFAINRLFFLNLGKYDPEMVAFGADNFELSFKVWQCGGRIVWVPCSHVGYIYRNSMFRRLKYLERQPKFAVSYKRVVETWFSEKQKEFFYTYQPYAKFLDVGNLSQQLELKKKLKCDTFDWYMNNVAYDVLVNFPEPPPNLYWGQLRSNATSKCLDTVSHDPPSSITIHKCQQNQTYNQLVRLNTKGQLAIGDGCIEADSQGIKFINCHAESVSGFWIYHENTFILLHRVYNKCMTLIQTISKLLLQPCESNNLYQQWYFKKILP